MAATANVVMNVDEWDPRWYQFQCWRIKLRRLTLFLDFGLGMFHQGLNFNRQLGRNTRLAYPVVRYRGIGWMRSRHMVRQSVALWHCSDTEIIQEISGTKHFWPLMQHSRVSPGTPKGRTKTFQSAEQRERERPPAELKWLRYWTSESLHVLQAALLHLVCMCSVVLCCYFVMLPFHRWWRKSLSVQQKQKDRSDSEQKTPKELGIQRLTIVSGKMCVEFGVYLYTYIITFYILYHIHNFIFYTYLLKN